MGNEIMGGVLMIGLTCGLGAGIPVVLVLSDSTTDTCEWAEHGTGLHVRACLPPDNAWQCHGLVHKHLVAEETTEGGLVVQLGEYTNHCHGTWVAGPAEPPTEDERPPPTCPQDPSYVYGLLLMHGQWFYGCGPPCPYVEIGREEGNSTRNERHQVCVI